MKAAKDEQAPGEGKTRREKSQW